MLVYFFYRDFFEHDPFGNDILADFFGPSYHGASRRQHGSRGGGRRMDPFAGFDSRSRGGMVSLGPPVGLPIFAHL